MFSNYLKIAIRYASRNKAYTIINVTGLVIGMCGAFLLFLWIRHEFSFEQFHENKNQLYVAWNRWEEKGEIVVDNTTPRVLAPTLEEEFPAVERAVSYASWGDPHLFQAGQSKLLVTSGVYTDPGFLTMFSFPLLAGDPSTALDGPNGIVLTEDFAQRLFGKSQVLGEPLSISQGRHRFEFVVTGVVKSLQRNTEFNFDYLLSFRFLESLGEKDTFWGNNSVRNLVQLKEGADRTAFNEQLKDVVKRHYADGQNIEIFLHPLTEMRLYSRFDNGVSVGGRIETVRLLMILAAGLIAIAAINFINLSTARAQRRAREVAVRKVTGAVRTSLIWQFLSESLFITAIAGLFSIALAWFLLPYFNELVKESVPMLLGEPVTWIGYVGFVLITGLLAGGYPALYTSSFRPVQILRGHAVRAKATFRSGLVMVQFGFAVMLVVSAIVVNKQLTFIQNRDAGYNMSNLAYIPLTGTMNRNFNSFAAELKGTGMVVSMTKASAPLTEQWSGTTDMEWQGRSPDEQTNIERIYVDENIALTAGLTIVQGRDMDLSRFPSDSTAAVINETALRLMGFDNPIGEIVRDGKHQWEIIGVVKDFVFTSPYQPVEPIILFGNKRKWANNVLYLKLNPEKQVTECIEMLGQLSTKYNPEYPFEYHFADADYQRKFAELQATLRLNSVFTALTIFVACLGLFGTAMFIAESRTKEIGIRKVMGGSVAGIVRLLGFTAMKPILLAMVVFTPMSFLAMREWLLTFAYRTVLDVWVFVTAGAVITVIAMLTIVWETVRAAQVNPVDSIRNE